MIALFRLVAAVLLAALFSFATWRFSAKLRGPAEVQAAPPALEDIPTLVAREPAGDVELRTFEASGREYRGPLRVLLVDAAGGRFQLAFASAPYRLLDLPPGATRVEIRGPLLAGTMSEFSVIDGESVRISIAPYGPASAAGEAQEAAAFASTAADRASL